MNATSRLNIRFRYKFISYFLCLHKEKYAKESALDFGTVLRLVEIFLTENK